MTASRVARGASADRLGLAFAGSPGLSQESRASGNLDMDSEPMARNSCIWHFEAVGHHAGVTCDPLDFESHEGALAAKGPLRLIGNASGDRTMVVLEGRRDACEHGGMENPR